MKLGFTGTRRGMTPQQIATFLRIVANSKVDTMLNGACIGADRDAVRVVWNMDIKILFYPGNKIQKAWANTLDRPKITVYNDARGRFLTRNKVIVANCDFLVATPAEDHEVKRSGTWSTVRYAESIPKSVAIILPDGSIVDYEGA